MTGALRLCNGLSSRSSRKLLCNLEWCGPVLLLWDGLPKQGSGCRESGFNSSCESAREPRTPQNAFTGKIPRLHVHAFQCRFVSLICGGAVRPIGKMIGWLCLLLTIWLAVASVVHYHPNAGEAATCTVCVASHASTASAQFSLPKVAFVFVSTIRARSIPARQHLFAFALSVRPPPAV